MTKLSRVLVIGAVLTGSCLTGHAGQLDSGLESQIASGNPNDKVPVWIKLPEVESAGALKAVAGIRATTRAGRYEITSSRLKINHDISQQNLVAHLKQMEERDLTGKIKTYWLTNVVYAEIAAAELETLAERDDIETIYAVPKLTLIRPVKASPAYNQALGVEPNLEFINADAAWAAGYTGEGTVICSFDSGIDGDHPALIESWKGHDGDSAAAWFDPKDQEPFPHVLTGVSASHGTHVMGIMVGHDDVSGDTVGVAPDAKWISAAVIDINGASIIDAFEWAADPDGDPNSIDDVPDVINHSWGVEDIGCMNVFYDLIDNLEALGIVNIFAAGNEGSGAQTIRNPANGADDSLDCFAVGGVITGNPPVIWTSSSRGPSDCNGAIKPNVTAPSQAVRSTYPNGNYGFLSGTSMAAPHAAGLAALLRQKNPNATADEIKAAMLTTANDFGYSLPDNNFGWGVVDCMAALNALSSTNAQPNVRPYAFDHEPIAAGDTVAGTVVLQNVGAGITGVTATLTGSEPSLTILNGTAVFGTLDEGDTLRSSDSIRVIVADTVTEGTILSLDFTINGDGAYQNVAKLHFLVEPAAQRLLATHDVNRVGFTVTNFGTYGLGNPSFFEAGGVGFTFDGGVTDLYEGGLIISTNSNNVSDGIRNAIGEPDGDFAVSPGGNIQLLEPGFVADQETFSVFSDSRAESPIGISVTQQSYAFADAPYDDFVIIRFILRNDNTFPVNNIRIGMYLDWDIVDYVANAGGWESADSVLWMCRNVGGTKTRFRGMKIVHGEAASGYTAQGTVVGYPEGFTEAEKQAALVDGFVSANTYINSSTDLLQVLAAGPLLLTAGQVDTVAYALAAANSLPELAAGVSTAGQIYDSLLLPCCIGMRGNIDNRLGEEPNVGDVTFLVDYLWKGGEPPYCMDEANVNGTPNGDVDVADLTYLVATLWQGGPNPYMCGEVQP